jgi:hypothetical protein
LSCVEIIGCSLILKGGYFLSLSSQFPAYIIIFSLSPGLIKVLTSWPDLLFIVLICYKIAVITDPVIEQASGSVYLVLSISHFLALQRAYNTHQCR